MATTTTTENVYSKLTAAELSALFLKGSPMSTLIERDAGFCSGSSENEDDMSMLDHTRDGPRSPTDASEDSVEVKVTPIILPKNKRKSSEPLRVVSELELGPIKKRIRYEEKFRTKINEDNIKMEPDQHHMDVKNPFRPWASVAESDTSTIPNPAEILLRHPGVTTLHRIPEQNQDQPLALVAKKQIHPTDEQKPSIIEHNNNNVLSYHPHHLLNNHNSLKESSAIIPRTVTSSTSPPPQQQPPPQIPPTMQHSIKQEQLPIPIISQNINSSNSSLPLSSIIDDTSSSASCSYSTPPSGSRSSNTNNVNNNQPQRNYKNMTRERRIEANARERTRVHTISAAFDTLRHAIPSYSNTQKLSKLSVLRIACSYILTLSRVAGLDYSQDESEPSIADCMELVTKTIQTEGKLRKKKDE